MNEGLSFILTTFDGKLLVSGSLVEIFFWTYDDIREDFSASLDESWDGKMEKPILAMLFNNTVVRTFSPEETRQFLCQLGDTVFVSMVELNDDLEEEKDILDWN